MPCSSIYACLWLSTDGEKNKQFEIEKIENQWIEVFEKMLRFFLRIIQNEVGIDAKLGVKALGKRHRDAATATQYLAQLGFVDT